MRTVKDVSKLTGVSVRTLHYYDAIGLLTPTKVTDAGYRMYDDTALSRLQSILLFREVQLPLKEIKEILDSNYLKLIESTLIKKKKQIKDQINELNLGFAVKGQLLKLTEKNDKITREDLIKLK